MNQSSELWRLFWAKTDRQNPGSSWTRPLWAHLLDVASTAELIWEQAIPGALKSKLSGAIGLDPDEAGRWFSLQIGLHDLGKAVPAFQSQHPSSKKLLLDAGFAFPDSFDRFNSIHHGHASIAILYRRIVSNGSLTVGQRCLLESVAAIVGFHHGKLATKDLWMKRSAGALGTGFWEGAQNTLLDEVVRVWNPPVPSITHHSSRAWPAWLLGLGGWATLADWMGSMAEHFPDVNRDDSLESYLSVSRTAAEGAFLDTGFQNRAALKKKPFGTLFRKRDEPISPRPLQQVIIDLELADDAASTLTIIEAPTGEGKTETAFYLSVRLASEGIYIAMPSQATSNSLFKRFEEFLSRAHDADTGPVNVILVHGNSLMHPEQEQLLRVYLDAPRTMERIYDSDDAKGDSEPRLETASWFLPKKRSLLAPYGVGTVDQAFLSILYSRHFFLRLFGLAGKTVVFDEVHAYDTYMNELFVRLLHWLRRMGAHVVILSATLPERERRRFMQVWDSGCSGGQVTPGQPTPYPAVWHVREGSNPAKPIVFPARRKQTIRLEWVSADVNKIAQNALEAALHGVSVAVVVNTVNRAQGIFLEIRRLIEGIHPPVDIRTDLFHARYLFRQRSALEERVLGRYGESRASGIPQILVGTQVIEQSLDLDFDVMFTDLAPVDLLLQRAGRLHRHDHHTRTAPFHDPVLHVMCPPADDVTLPDVEEVSGRGHVYDRSILFRTWVLLKNRSKIHLPDDYRPLIESVYSEGASDPPEGLTESHRERWQSAERDLKERRQEEENEAKRRLIPFPDDLKEMVTFDALELADDDEADPRLHEHFRALTRLGGPSVETICLFEDKTGLRWLDPECKSDPFPKTPLRKEDVRVLLQNAVRISGYRATWLFELEDDRWAKAVSDSPALNRYRPLVFRDNTWRHSSGNTITFHPELGIIFPQNKEE